MKTKELVQILQEVDPSGESEVCVDNLPVWVVERMPAYWDGPLQVLIQDKTNPYYNVTGAKYVRSGDKVKIRTLSIVDAICNNTNLEVDYSELRDPEATKKAHDELRKWYVKMENGLELGYFVKWAEKHASQLTVDLQDIKDIATEFFKEAGMEHSDPLPEGGIPTGMSYVDTRNKQWDEKFKVVLDNGFLSIKEIGEENEMGS